MAVSVILGERSLDAPGLRAGPEGPCRVARHRRGEGFATCAAARLRQPSPAERRRPSRGPAATRARRYLDDADLYACARGTAEGAGRRASPAGEGEGVGR